MLGISIDNRVVRTFIYNEVSKIKNSSIMELDINRLLELESIILRSMYYSKVIVLLNISNESTLPNNQTFKSVVTQLLNNGIGLIIMVNSTFILKRIQDTLNSTGHKYKELSVSTINSVIVKDIVNTMYFTAVGKNLTPGILNNLVRRIRKMHKVDAFLDEIMLQKTTASVKDLISYKNKIYSGNFASHLICHTQTSDVSLYIQQNISSIPYVFTILDNFIVDILYLYPQYISGEFNEANLHKFKTGEIKGKFNKYGADPQLYLSVMEMRSYEYLYILSERIKKADTRTKRIVLIGEMLL